MRWRTRGGRGVRHFFTETTLKALSTWLRLGEPDLLSSEGAMQHRFDWGRTRVNWGGLTHADDVVGGSEG